MRIISGKYRGRVLMSPQGSDIRPSTDRIKENIFNILQKYNTDGIILDLFAGSGALGIEALSRGASRVIFVDTSKESTTLVKANLDKIKADLQAYEIFCTDYTIALKKLQGTQFDIILIDPPYNSVYAQKAIELISQHDLLRDGGVIVVERAKEEVLTIDAQVYIEDLRVYGNTCVSFITRQTST